MKKPSVIAAAIILFVFALSTSNCSKSSSSPNKPTFEVQLQSNATVNNFLVDKKGHSLYFFATDVNGQSNCTGACEVNWPVVSDSNLIATQLGTGLTASDFSSIKTSEGKTQLTYKGWPLYNFSPGGAQEAVGQTTGDGADAGLFVVAKPDYTIMLGSGQLHGLDGNDYTSTYTVGQGITTYFTDAWGATLYTFVIDSANHNKFTKSDFTNNPTFPIYDTTSIVVPSTVNKALFTNTTVFGKNQLTYNGYPLYYFGADSTHRGSTKAVSVGPKKWPVATPTTPAAPHL